MLIEFTLKEKQTKSERQVKIHTRITSRLKYEIIEGYWIAIEK